MRNAIDPPTMIPCPPWCARESGHGFDTISPETGVLTRFHERSFGDYVDLTAAEQALSDHGPALALSEPRMNVYGDDDLSVEQARELAQAVLAAVEFLDGLR